MMLGLCDRNMEMSCKEQEKYILERRQKLKEVMRLKMRNENAALFGVVGCQDFVKELPHDDYGSFFGPSQPAISQRVLQECKSLLETKIEKSANSVAKSEVVHDSKSRVKDLKYNRDYSLLLSGDSELPAMKKESVPECTKPPVSNNSKPVSKAWEPRQPNVSSAESRKQLASNKGNQTRQHMGQKGMLSKVSDPIKKTSSLVGMKKTGLGMKKESLHCVPSSVQKEQKRGIRESEKVQLNSKTTVGMKTASVSNLQKRKIQEAEKAKHKLKRRQNFDASAMIREMFGYDPRKYAGLDEDDSNMVTSYQDLSKEDKRSEKLAREEDREQLRLIEEEARREKMKKEAKRRKLSKSE
ncbi:hypothetical protein AQUCO_01000281v1 [Aquilegia coerulea]|uniref:SPT2 chromatin protein n=1 Tax=Aquilegia coerulea TaxID=218851 RepID=A0A2G5E968_AQUCA|nr:hypothetical protein AQUCO_01000281v1 [Aquilegia coerulea]